MSIGKTNKLLINVYGNKEYYDRKFLSEGIYNFEKTWEEEIKKELKGYEELEDILERRE